MNKKVLKMSNEHLEMLSQLLQVVEIISGKKLTDNQKGMLEDILRITYHDGDRKGAERMRKIIEDARR
jgi:hypothetical protein